MTDINITFKFPTFLVGGALRDELLGVPSKDLDFLVLAPSFDAMREMLVEQGADIFVEKPEFLTIRCKHPVLGVADFATGRVDGESSDGRRPDSVKVTTNIVQDLARRDFTCNAMAKSVVTGAILDLFDGQIAIRSGLIVCVGNPDDRLREDKLRAFRALRFAVTKNFDIDLELQEAIKRLNKADFHAISTERIRDELAKMFTVSAGKSFRWLAEFPCLDEIIEDRGIWFKPTTEKK